MEYPTLSSLLFSLIGLLKKQRNIESISGKRFWANLRIPLLPPNPQTRKIYDKERWTGYEVVLDVYPNLFASGIFLIPKDIKPGEKRPVVVCQHGRSDIPQKLVEGNHTAYNNVAAKLADQGFIVYAPQNPYRWEDRYRWLSRKGNTIKKTLFSFIISQHEQTIQWLGTLPFVDKNRIAFYGLVMEVKLPCGYRQCWKVTAFRYVREISETGQEKLRMFISPEFYE